MADSNDPAGQLSALRESVVGGQVCPRDASLWAGLAGLKILPEKKADSADTYGVGTRQAFTVESRVEDAVRQTRQVAAGAAFVPPLAADTHRPDRVSTTDESGSFALIEGELALSDHRYQSDGQRALQTLRALVNDAPLTRAKEATGPVEGLRRVRQHRYRRHLLSRAELLGADPARSVNQPYLVVPSRLAPADLAHVPACQLRRGKPPEHAWLAGQVAELRRSYKDRDGRAARLSRIVAWAFAQYGNSPDPSLEAAALAVAAAVAREQDSMAAHWFAQRIRFLVGDLRIEALSASLDSVIVLRNSGYWTQSRTVMERSMAQLRSGGDSAAAAPDAWLSMRRLLGQLTTHFFTGPKSIISAEAARAYLRVDIEESGIGRDPYWYPLLLRNTFEIEMAIARRRAQATSERFWLTSAGRLLLDRTDAAMADCPEPMWQAQWALLRMRLGLFRRDIAEVTDAANAYFAAGAAAPFVIRDHPSERHEYRRTREAAVHGHAALERILPELAPEHETVGV